MVPGYLKTFRQAIQKPEGYEINEKNEISEGADEGLNSFNSFISYPAPLDLSSRNAPPDGEIDHTSLTYQAAFDTLERRCPDHIPSDRWRQAVEDGRQFLAVWGARAETLDWTSTDLFGLPELPDQPRADHDRLRRVDALGLCWLLKDRRAIELTAEAAVIRTDSGGTLRYYRKRTLPAEIVTAAPATPTLQIIDIGKRVTP